MCGKTPKPPPPVVQRDPVAEQAKLEAEAATKANAETASRRRRRGMSGGIVNAVRRAQTLAGTDGSGPSLLKQATPEG